MTDDEQTLARTETIRVPITRRALLRGHVETTVYLEGDDVDVDVGYGEVVDDEES